VPKVSIIVPNYNHAPFLKERLDSIFNQTYQDFEVILLDDCSTDNSVEVLKQYAKNQRVSHFEVNPINSGSPFKQWKKGIELAKGEWIWIAESDDVADANFLKKLLDFKDNTFDLVYCRSNRINEKGDTVPGDYFWPDGLDNQKWKKDFEADGNNEITNSFLYRNVLPNASSCVFKSNVVPNFNQIITYKYAGDWLFWVMLLQNNKMKFVADKLNYFRAHSLTSRSLKSKIEEEERIKEYFDIIAFINRNFKISKHITYKNYNWVFEYIFNNRKLIKLKWIIYNLPINFSFRYFKFYLNNIK